MDGVKQDFDDREAKQLFLVSELVCQTTELWGTIIGEGFTNERSWALIKKVYEGGYTGKLSIQALEADFMAYFGADKRAVRRIIDEAQTAAYIEVNEECKEIVATAHFNETYQSYALRAAQLLIDKSTDFDSTLSLDIEKLDKLKTAQLITDLWNGYGNLWQQALPNLLASVDPKIGEGTKFALGRKLFSTPYILLLVFIWRHEHRRKHKLRANPPDQNRLQVKLYNYIGLGLGASLRRLDENLTNEAKLLIRGTSNQKVVYELPEDIYASINKIHKDFIDLVHGFYGNVPPIGATVLSFPHSA